MEVELGPCALGHGQCSPDPLLDLGDINDLGIPSPAGGDYFPLSTWELNILPKQLQPNNYSGITAVTPEGVLFSTTPGSSEDTFAALQDVHHHQLQAGPLGFAHLQQVQAAAGVDKGANKDPNRAASVTSELPCSLLGGIGGAAAAAVAAPEIVASACGPRAVPIHISLSWQQQQQQHQQTSSVAAFCTGLYDPSMQNNPWQCSASGSQGFLNTTSSSGLLRIPTGLQQPLPAGCNFSIGRPQQQQHRQLQHSQQQVHPLTDQAAFLELRQQWQQHPPTGACVWSVGPLSSCLTGQHSGGQPHTGANPAALGQQLLQQQQGAAGASHVPVNVEFPPGGYLGMLQGWIDSPIATAAVAGADVASECANTAKRTAAGGNTDAASNMQQHSPKRSKNLPAHQLLVDQQRQQEQQQQQQVASNSSEVPYKPRAPFIPRVVSQAEYQKQQSEANDALTVRPTTYLTVPKGVLGTSMGRKANNSKAAASSTNQDNQDDSSIRSLAKRKNGKGKETVADMVCEAVNQQTARALRHVNLEHQLRMWKSRSQKYDAALPDKLAADGSQGAALPASPVAAVANANILEASAARELAACPEAAAAAAAAAATRAAIWPASSEPQSLGDSLLYSTPDALAQAVEAAFISTSTYLELALARIAMDEGKPQMQVLCGPLPGSRDGSGKGTAAVQHQQRGGEQQYAQAFREQAKLEKRHAKAWGQLIRSSSSLDEATHIAQTAMRVAEIQQLQLHPETLEAAKCRKDVAAAAGRFEAEKQRKAEAYAAEYQNLYQRLAADDMAWRQSLLDLECAAKSQQTHIPSKPPQQVSGTAQSYAVEGVVPPAATDGSTSTAQGKTSSTAPSAAAQRHGSSAGSNTQPQQNSVGSSDKVHGDSSNGDGGDGPHPPCRTGLPHSHCVAEAPAPYAATAEATIEEGPVQEGTAAAVAANSGKAAKQEDAAGASHYSPPVEIQQPAVPVVAHARCHQHQQQQAVSRRHTLQYQQQQHPQQQPKLPGHQECLPDARCTVYRTVAAKARGIEQQKQQQHQVTPAVATLEGPATVPQQLGRLPADPAAARNLLLASAAAAANYFSAVASGVVPQAPDSTFCFGPVSSLKPPASGRAPTGPPHVEAATCGCRQAAAPSTQHGHGSSSSIDPPTGAEKPQLVHEPSAGPKAAAAATEGTPQLNRATNSTEGVEPSAQQDTGLQRGVAAATGQRKRRRPAVYDECDCVEAPEKGVSDVHLIGVAADAATAADPSACADGSVLSECCSDGDGTDYDNDYGVNSLGQPRGRTNAILMDALRELFDLPMAKAAKALGIGQTMLKARCRKLKINRWPHRKLQSLSQLMQTVKTYGTNSGKVKDANEVYQQLQGFREEVLANPNKDLTHQIKQLRQAIFKQEYKARRVQKSGCTTDAEVD